MTKHSDMGLLRWERAWVRENYVPWCRTWGASSIARFLGSDTAYIYSLATGRTHGYGDAVGFSDNPRAGGRMWGGGQEGPSGPVDGYRYGVLCPIGRDLGGRVLRHRRLDEIDGDFA